VIHVATGNVTANITVGNGPDAIAITPDGSQLYVTNNDDGTVSIIDTSNNAVLGTITVGTQPDAVAIFTPPSNCNC
jgi:YVTN family beta-propeller protein